MPQGPIAGTAFLKVDGGMIPLKGNLTVSSSPVERTGIAGQDYVHGYQELPRVPYIEGDVSTLPEISLETLEGIIDATVTAELINGSVYVLRNAWTKGPLEINTHDGQFRIRFEGVQCDEVQ
ncbi:phage tail tube protein [Bradyrhizobium sp. BRP22]|uniref:phage tail tube protein n=1 Tax=Bradyrhizobium sp. BRP22 TaxID=2793821 RepID=UPI001CD3BF29|nr:phage tail tube protein [Bradyrhizobium sp. BRP22]MCA1452836.1 phage tail tube protein [Bradyrhizobium sp. BRP22]